MTFVLLLIVVVMSCLNHYPYQYPTMLTMTPNKPRHHKAMIMSYISNSVNRDIDIAKQKEKIKYLKEKVNQTEHHVYSNSLGSSNHIDIETILSQNRLLNQRCQLYKEKLLSIENENKRLNSVIDERTQMIDQYEVVIKDSKMKLVQLSNMNDILIQTIEKRRNDSSNSFVNQRRGNDIKHIDMIKQRGVVNEKDSRGLIDQMKELKAQIRTIENIFIEKDKVIDQLHKDNESIILNKATNKVCCPNNKSDQSNYKEVLALKKTKPIK